MFKSYPQIHLDRFSPDSRVLSAVDLKDQIEKNENCVKYTKRSPITRVVIDINAVLCITNHISESNDMFEGELNGMHINGVVEVTNAIPVTVERATDPLQRGENERKARENVQRIRTAMKDSSFEFLHIGNYISTRVGKYFEQRIINKLEELLKNNSLGILILYDSRRTSLGKLYLRAYTLSESYVNFFLAKRIYDEENPHDNLPKRREITKKYINKFGVCKAGILEELPVSIHASIDQQLLMQDYIDNPQLPIISTATADHMKYGQELIGELSDILKVLSSPINFLSSGLEVKAILAMEEANELAKFLESISDSVLMNSVVPKEV